MLAIALMLTIGYAANSVTSPSAPQVVATQPANGAIVPAGPVTISVTYDRPLRAGSYSFVQVSPSTHPDCSRIPSLSADRRTYSLSCRVAPGRSYELWFNRGRFQNFVGENGVSASPYQLRFRAR